MVQTMGLAASNRARPLIVVVALILSLVSVAVFVRFSFRWMSMDYETFWVASRMPIPAIYSGPRYTYIYPPTAIPFLWPLSLASYWTGFTTMTLLSVAAFLASAKRLFGPKVALLSLLSFPALQGLMWGQTAMLLAAGLFAALSLKGFQRGFVIGLMASIKPQLFIAAPLVFVVRRDYRALAGAVVGGLAMTLASVALFGVDVWFEWLSALPGFQTEIVDRNVAGAASPLGVAIVSGWPVAPVAAASLILAAWLIFRTRNSDDPAVLSAVIGGASILCSPYALFHDCIVLVPAAVAFLLLDRPTLKQLPAMLTFCGLAVPIALPGLLLSLTLSPRHERLGVLHRA